MTKRLGFVAAALLCLGAVALAAQDLPDPNNSIIVLSGQSTPCHYKFRADGSGDHLVVDVQVLDLFANPVPNCPITCEFIANTGTLALCSCCPILQEEVTNPAGVVQFEFEELHGRGSLDVAIIAQCGPLTLAERSIEFTSTDLNAGGIGDCGVTNIFDLGVMGASLGSSLPLQPPAVYANYTCDDTVDVFDLGFLGGGLAVTCIDAMPCP